MRHLELNFFLSCFPEKYTENDAVTAIANTLKRASDKTGESGQKKGLELASADFIADKLQNDNGLIGSEEEEDTSSESFDKMSMWLCKW